MYLEIVFGSIGNLLNHSVTQAAMTIMAAIVLQLVLRNGIARVVRKAVRGHKFASKLDEEKREDTLITIFRTALAVVIWVVAIIVILWQLRVNIAALMTGAGLVGIIVGFGAQAAIKDFLAGIFIIAENQYRVGDIVTLRAAGVDVSGVVEDVTIRITRLRDLDGNLHIVQNGSTSVVTNRSFGFANVNVDVRVSYQADISKVEKVINEVGQKMHDDPDWTDIVIEPIKFLRVDGFEDSGVCIKALGKVEPAMQWAAAGEFRRRLKKAFEKNGIAIALPQIVINQAKL